MRQQQPAGNGPNHFPLTTMINEDEEEEKITLSRTTVTFACQTMEHFLKSNVKVHPVTEGYIKDSIKELREKLGWKKLDNP